MSEQIQVSKSVPVADEVDVLVAGGGISGPMAALSAAREGARTMLVDRFGYIGGNMGPGMFSGGVLHMGLKQPFAQLNRLSGLTGEFLDRVEGHCDHLPGRDYFRDSQVVAYVWQRMMAENNVELMLNTFATDPIMDGRTVRGLILETRSGAVAVRAKVVIDATGNAEIGARAGAEMLDGPRYVHPGMYFAIAGVDTGRYVPWRDAQTPCEEDSKWAREVQETLGSWGVGKLKPFHALMRKAWNLGEYRFVKPIGTVGVVTMDHGFYQPLRDIVGAQVGVADSSLLPEAKRQIAAGDCRVMQELELGCRQYIFETAQFMRRYVPGFENAHLHMIAPYFHGRGSQGMICRYRLTPQDAESGAHFDDVVMQDFDLEGHPPYEFPYRQLVPKGLGGLLATGKSAIIDPPSNRSRWKMLILGEVAGVAAAQAVRQGVSPEAINVRDLQRELLCRRHTLGTPERLAELGLA